MYVPQTFSAELRYCFLDETLRQDLGIPRGLVRLTDIRALEQRINKLMRVLDYLEACSGGSVRPEGGGNSRAALTGYIDSVHQDWRAACKAYAATALKEFETLTAEDRKGGAATRRREPIRAAPKLPTERTIATAVESGPATRIWLARAQEVQSLIVRLIEDDCLRLRTARKATQIEWLSSSDDVAYCRMLDLEESVPGSIVREQNGTTQRLSFEGGFLDNAPRMGSADRAGWFW